MADEYEDLMKEIARVQAAWQREQTTNQKALSPSNLSAVYERAPAWITLLVAAAIGYSVLNTRVSTCEYQNQISIADRADLRRRVDKTGDTLAEVNTALGEIKVTLKELAGRGRR